MLVVEILDAEEITRERASALERNPEEKIGPGIACIGAIEREVASAPGCIRRGRIVAPEVHSDPQRMCPVNPGYVVQDLVFVIAELNGAEGIRIESEISADAQTRESWKSLD